MRIGYFKKYPYNVYGIQFERKHITGMIKMIWILIFYYGSRYRLFANYKVSL